ncbi:Respirasome Complex Assembly Factor 1 [Linum grandiflorum]
MKESKSAKLSSQQQDQLQQPLQQQHQNGHLSPSKQVVALLCGLIWGAIPLVGGIWIGIFLLISSGIIYGYYGMILQVDEEDFGGHGALLQEGLFASVTVFLLSWTLVYSLAHF